MRLSVVISTYNRKDSLARCLDSVKVLADEIIVIDNESTDATAETAKRYGAIVLSRPNNLMLNVNKNFGFSKATNDWILCLDDDEVIPSVLADNIRKSISNPEITGYWIPRKNYIFGKWIQHGIWWPDRQLRLFRRGYGRYPEKHVHEYITVDGPVSTLTVPFIHHNYDTLGQYLEKMQSIYTESEVQKYVSAGYLVRWQDAIRFPLSDFLKLYLAQSGFKDGLHGLVLSLLQSYYAFVIFVKLWEREKFRQIPVPLSEAAGEISKSGTEVRYWVRTAQMKESGSRIIRTWYRLLRRLRLTT